jgi:hypothetical protein
MSDPSPATAAYAPPESTSALAHVLDDYVAALKAGRQPDRAAVVADHPELAPQLDSCLAALDFIHRADEPAAEAPAHLGDYRILREVGRGGMGVVYEAEQLSLKRRVALKVLRFGAAPDPEALQRFQREAETVARLHHTNIVPVFAVGCEQGVHYYAMQFIDGQGLDRAAAAQRADCAQVARWGVQAAEALAHAHARGVIHRDIKPSNLLLDAEGVVWLTDFGLARRADEVTLTMTGLLVGTPRYMSPEQAAATRQPVDQRSDVYSLGATLYELATGAPVYDGDTPQRLLAQILQDEPLPPHRHRPDVPRDLETILLKCLAKEPERRYTTSQALADDLRRFINGDAIKARRPTVRERARRWWRRYHSAAVLAAACAAAGLLVAVGLFLGSRRVERWFQGQLFLATDGPALSAELLTPAGDPACPSFTVPTEASLALPAGDYLLRLRGRGYLDETFQVRVDRGVERAFDVSLAEQRPWEPITLERCYDLAEIDGRTDVFVLTERGVVRRHGGTGAVLWTADLDEKSHPALAGFRWDWDIHGCPSGRGAMDRRPRLHRLGPDLVWISRRQAAAVALAGSDGHVLWCWQAAPPKLAPNTRFGEESASTGTVLGPPVLLDIDGDGTPDLVVTCAQQAEADGSVPRWVEALSGRSGKSLWRCDLDGAWFAPPTGTAVPDGSRWDNMIALASSSSVGHRSMPNQLYDKGFMLSGGGLPVPYPAVAVRLDGRDVLAVSAGTRLVTLDPRDGRPLAPAQDLGVWPIRAPQFADLDGDGRPDVLLLGPSPDAQPAEAMFGMSFPPDDDRLTLTARTLDTGRPLWRETLRAYWGWNWFQEPFEWPLVADLAGDGRPAVIVPTGDFAGDSKWSGVEVRDGATGAVRWSKKLIISTRFGQVQQVNRLLVGPDLDGDGVRDLFTAVLDGQDYPADRPYRSVNVLNFDKDYAKPVLRVDALSGKDGNGLWWVAEPVRHGGLNHAPGPTVGPLHWWQPGADGWPQLLVPYEDPPHAHYLFSAGSGERLHLSSELQDVRVADIDGDGVPDLVSFRTYRPDVFDKGGELVAVRGRSPEAWRRLGGYWTPTADLDGDGIPDLLSAPPPEKVGFEDRPPRRDAALRSQQATDKPLTRVVSGRDGRLLWQAEITDGKPTANWQASRYQHVVAGADLDGDGVPDLLATGRGHTMHMTGMGMTFSPLVAVSGRTGRHLWTADIQVDLWNGPQLLECRDLDGDGRPEVLFVSASDWDWPRGENNSRSTNDWQYWLAVLDGATGRVKWRQPLSERNTSNVNSQPAWTPFAFAVADLQGDGSTDLVIEAGLPEKDGEVRAFRGRDGEPLWTWKPEPRPLDHGNFRPKRPTFTVGDLGGRRVVVVLHIVTQKHAQWNEYPHVEVVALDASTGRPLWSWRRAVDGDYNDTQNGAVRSRIVPQLVELGGGRRAVCLPTCSHDERTRVTLLDEQGHELRIRAVDFRLRDEDRERQRRNPQVRYSPVYSPHFRVWCRDLDGDGADELIVLSNERLQVLAGDLSAVRWEWPLPDTDCALLQVYPAEGKRPATLAVRAGNRVVGLAGNDGRQLWNCAGPGTPLALLAGDTYEEQPGVVFPLPRVVFDLGDQVTVCRRGLPGANDLAWLRGFQGYAPPEAEDPRYVRPLPWNAVADRPPLIPASPWGIALALGGLSLAVVVMPAWLWWRTLRGRRWLLALVPFAWLALVWAGVCLLYLAFLNDDASFRVSQVGWWVFIRQLGQEAVKLAPVGLPLVAFVVAAARWLRQGRWGRLAALLLAAAGLAGVAAWVWLRRAAPELADYQHFSRRGWLGIVPAGAYAVGLLVVAGWLLRMLFRLVRSVVRRLRPAPSI